MRAKGPLYFLIAVIAVMGIAYATFPKTTTTVAGSGNSGSGSNGTSGAALSAKFTQLNHTLLQTAFEQADCKANFTVSYLTQAMQIIPNTSTQFGASISTLNKDATQLQSYEYDGNVSSYRSFLSGTFDPELANIRSSFRSVVRFTYPTPSQISQLTTAYQSALARYNQCEFGTLKQFALNKLSYYQTSLSSYQQEAINLSAKGLQVGTMEFDVSKANSTIVLPFESAINDATNVSQLEAAVQRFCLFDGCPNGIDGHLAAHFDYDKLSAVVAKLQTYNLTRNQTTELNTAQGYLSAADSALAQAGISKYTTSDNPWGDLENASSTLRQVLER